MATSTGKTVVLILLVLLILSFIRLTPLLLAPFGVFTGVFHDVGVSSIRSISAWPRGFQLTSLSLLSIAFFILWIVVIVWVYRDAERRGMNGVLWALLVLIGNIIGLLIYLIIRSDNLPAPRDDTEIPGGSDSPATITCPNCQKPVGRDFAFCPLCGTRLQKVCPGCGKPIEESWVACPLCGKKLG